MINEGFKLLLVTQLGINLKKKLRGENKIMDNHSVFLEGKEYFRYFEEKYNNKLFIQEYPLIAKRMKTLCEAIKEKIYNIESSNFFRTHAEVLGLDAQLQILLTFVDSIQHDSGFSEAMILKCSMEDYTVFMKEFCGMDIDDIADHSLYFSVI